jgi:enoyl-CoA hydratase/carnithine racemase
MATKLSEYAEKYETIHLEREDGLLLMELHSGDGSLVWGDLVHRELIHALHDISTDPETHVIVFTGRGDIFLNDIDRTTWGANPEDPDVRERMFHECKLLLKGFMDLPVPVIGAVNGPARLHAELPLLSDIVLAADTAVFQDTAHFFTGGVPGDGVNVLWPMWLGPNRGRHFLLTGEEIYAEEALRLGLVGQVLPPDKLMDRAWEIARDFNRRPRISLRATRLALTLGIRRVLNADLDEGLALEFLSRAWIEKSYPYITRDTK